MTGDCASGGSVSKLAECLMQTEKSCVVIVNSGRGSVTYGVSDFLYNSSECRRLMIIFMIMMM